MKRHAICSKMKALVLMAMMLPVAAFSQTINVYVMPDMDEHGTVNGTNFLEFSSCSAGTVIDVTAVGTSPYDFVRWEDAMISEPLAYVTATTNPMHLVITNEIIDEVTNDYGGELYIIASFSAGNVSVSAVSVPQGAGSFTGTGSYPYGSTAAITVTHENSEYYLFEGWSFNPNPAEPKVYQGSYFTFPATADTIAYAHYSYKNHRLTVTAAVDPVAAGTATVTYDATTGTSVTDIPENNNFTLTANANDGYTFTGWSRGSSSHIISTESTWTHAMPGFSSDSTYTAHFTSPESRYNVTLVYNTDGGNPTASPASNILSGATVTLNPGTYSGYTFIGWYEDFNGNGVYDNDELLSTEANYSFNITANRTFQARYEHNPWTLTLNVNPDIAGNITTTGDNGDGTVNDRASLTVTASVADGQQMNYRFDRWSGDNTTTNPSINIAQVTRNYSFTANFINTYTLTATASNGGNVTVTPSSPANANGTYDINTDITLTANVVDGREFAFWTIDGVDRPDLTTNTYVVEDIDHHTTVLANYVPTHTVTINANPGDVDDLELTINGNPCTPGTAYTFREGADVTVAVASFNTTTFEYLKWTNSGSADQINNDGDQFYSFTMGTSNRSLVVYFQPRAVNYTVTTSVNNDAWGYITSDRVTLVDGIATDVVAGTTLDLLAHANDGYIFDHWDVDGVNYNNNPLNDGASVRVNNNMNITAYFREQGVVNVTIVKHPNNTVGTITPIDNTSEWPAGTPLTLTATVTNANYQFWGWIIDGAPMGAMGQANLTFTPTTDVTVHAWFYAPSIDGNVDYLEYSADSSIVTGVKSDYRRRVTSIAIPVLHNGAVTEIADGAFQGCTSLETLELVPTITTVGDYAFAGCTSLNDIDVSSVTSFGVDAFNGCTALQNVTLSNHLTAIPGEMFYNCTALQNVVIPATVTSIGNAAFYGCRNLYSIEIPAAVTTVGAQAFMGNSNMRVVTINGGVTSFGNDAFKSSNNIAQVNFNGTMAQWCGIEFENMLANPATRSHSLTVNGTLLTNLVIPAGVTTVHAFAFYQNTNIESITIPASVTTIDSAAFGRLTNLRRIVLEGDPSAITVDEDAFINVTKANVTVEVPCAYTALTEWNGFTNIVGAGVPVLTLVQRVGGTVAITSTPDCGSAEYTYHITAQATAGIYQFVSWSDGAMSPDRDITITEDMTLSAIFNRSYATAPITNKTYDFEAGNAALEWFNIGTGDNEWTVGDAEAHSSFGTHSLYVSKDGGTNCNYNLGSEPYVYTEMKLYSGVYRFNFNYLINDIEDHNVTIALIPIEDGEPDDAYMNLNPYAGAYPLLIDELNGNGNWQDAHRLFQIPTEQWYRLAIFWNLNSDDAPANVAAAVDNLTLTWMDMTPSELNSLTATVSVGTDDATMGKAYTWTGDETQFTMGAMTIPVTQEAVHANTLFNLFTINDEVWIHALPETGYRFVRWDDGNTDQDRQLEFFSVYGNSPHFIAYFEPIPVDWTITVLLEASAEEAGVPASGEYGVIYKLGEATIAGNTYDVNEVRPIASIDDDPSSQATLVVNQPLAEWAFMGWANENGDTVSRENPWTITYGDYNRDVVFTALMSKRVECPDVDDYIYSTNPGNNEPSTGREMPELRDVIVSNINVFVENNQIVVENTGDYNVTLYDVAGRAIESRISPDNKIYFNVPLSGSYLIRVGDVMTQRVVVVK